MTPRQRVLATLAGQPTDKIAVHHVGISSAVASTVLGREAYIGGGIQQWREAKALWEGPDAHAEFLERTEQDVFDVCVATGQDIFRWEYWRMDTKPTARRDEYTFVYGDPDGDWQVMQFDPRTELYQVIEQHHTEPPPATMEDLEPRLRDMQRHLDQYRPDGDAATAGRFMQLHGDQYVVRFHAGFFGLPLPDGEALWLQALVLRPDLVERYLDVQVQQSLLKFEALASAGVTMVFGGGDFASNKGPFFSPKLFAELYLPRLRRMTDACHAWGLYYLFASDGNLWPVADDLFDVAGIDGFYEIDRRAGMDLRKLRDRYPRLNLIGNISSHNLHRGTKDDVIRETRSCLDEAHRSGHVIVGLSNYPLPGTPEANVHAMLETITRYR